MLGSLVGLGEESHPGNGVLMIFPWCARSTSCRLRGMRISWVRSEGRKAVHRQRMLRCSTVLLVVGGLVGGLALPGMLLSDPVLLAGTLVPVPG